jgi:hypothetical protein
MKFGGSVARFPGDLGDEKAMAGVAGEYEEIIAEAVEIAKYEGLDGRIFFL